MTLGSALPWRTCSTLVRIQPPRRWLSVPSLRASSATPWPPSSSTNGRPATPSSASPAHATTTAGAASSLIDRLSRLPVRPHRDWGIPRAHWAPAVVLRPDTPYPHKVESRESLRRSHRILKQQYQLETKRPQKGKPGDWRTILRYLIRYSPAYVPPEEGVRITISNKALELLLSDHRSNLWNIKARTKCTMTLYRPAPGPWGAPWPWDDRVQRTEKGEEDAPPKERALKDGWGTEPYVVLSGEPTAVVAAVDEIVKVSRSAIYDRTEDSSAEASTPEEQSAPPPDTTQDSLAELVKVERLNTPSPAAGQAEAAFAEIPVRWHPVPIPSRPYKLYERVDAIPRPKEWTVSSFQQYVAAITMGRPHGSLARHLYPGRQQSHQKTVVRLLHDVFNDPAAASAVSVPALQRALEYLVAAGSTFVRDAEALRDRAKELGLRLDTDVYNRMAQTAVKTKNLLVFQSFVGDMVLRGYQPNVRTWLLFLRIIEAEDVRRYILKAMAAKNYFSDPKVVNEVAVEMADHDIYRAIQMGQDVDAFVGSLHELYGPEWTLHTRAANRYLDVLGRYSKLDDCKRLLELMFASQRAKPNTITLNTAITHCKLQRKIDLAIELLQMFEKEGYPHLVDGITLHLLFEAARKTKKPHLLGAVWKYAHLTAQTNWDMRRRGIKLLAGEHKMLRLTKRLSGLWENPDECKMSRLEFVESLLLNYEEINITPGTLRLEAATRGQAQEAKDSVALRLRSRLLTAGDSAPELVVSTTEMERDESGAPGAIEYYYASTHRLIEKAKARSRQPPKPLYAHIYDAYEHRMSRAAHIWRPKTPLGDYLREALERDRLLHKLAHSGLGSAQIFQDGVPAEMAPVKLALQKRPVQGFKRDPVPPRMRELAQRDKADGDGAAAIRGTATNPLPLPTPASTPTAAATTREMPDQEEEGGRHATADEGERRE
ncbi:hypothetical protein VTJ83DRAFT_7388 [Remersonia thermophila]|uniref:Pentatricopeptide repeat-containing protein n=1 Tax=Remersonia thermophila TaxID=72144 RepID=A0ABR4D3C8_9PEZI